MFVGTGAPSCIRHQMIDSGTRGSFYHTSRDSPGSSSSGISDNISRFKYLLSESRLSDLDVWMIFPMDNNYFVMRLMLHAFALLAPYSHQIRILRLWSQPLRALLSILNDFKPLPRLASLNLEFPSTEVIPSPYDFLSVDHVDSVLDLSGEKQLPRNIVVKMGPSGRIYIPLQCLAPHDSIRISRASQVEASRSAFQEAPRIQNIVFEVYGTGWSSTTILLHRSIWVMFPVPVFPGVLRWHRKHSHRRHTYRSALPHFARALHLSRTY